MMKTTGKRYGYTMIELIFVMVIIGILAAVSIPKLAIARNDAKASVIVTRLSNCVELAGKGYLESGKFDVNETNCKRVVQESKCFTLTPDDVNGTLTVTHVSGATQDCVDAQKLAEKNKLSLATGSVHRF